MNVNKSKFEALLDAVKLLSNITQNHTKSFREQIRVNEALTKELKQINERIQQLEERESCVLFQ